MGWKIGGKSTINPLINMPAVMSSCSTPPDTNHVGAPHMSTSPRSLQRKEGDDWTMVDRVSELMDIEGMSDISLPPLPPFETGSQQGASDDDREGRGGAYDPSPQQRRAPGDETTEFSGCASDSSAVAGGIVGKAAVGRKRGASTRRRVSGWPRGSSTRAAMSETSSSSSVSPQRPRRRPGRTERNGRRVNEGPLPLQSASGASDDDSASISSSSLDLSSSSPPPATCRSPLNRTLGGSGRGLIITGALRRGSRSSIDNLASSFISKGRSLEHDEEEEDERGGATGGSESALVPFSLEEITCVASETVSASSSPFRTQQGARLERLSTASSRDGAVAAAVPAVSSGGGNDFGVGVPLALDREDEMPRPTSAVNIGVGGCCGDSRTSGPSNHESFSTASQLSYASVFHASATSARGHVGGGAGTIAPRSRLEGEGGGAFSPALAGLASARILPVAACNRDRLTPESMVESGAWSLSSRGMTPLGRLFGAGGGGTGFGTAAEWGAGSVGVTRATGSMMGFSSGYRTAVLEARADAAEEQGEFWQRRARAAEEANRLLRKVISAQAQKISDLASKELLGGVEECKLAPPSDGEEREQSSRVGVTEGVLGEGSEHKEEGEGEELVESWRDALDVEAVEDARGDEEKRVVDGFPEAIGGITFTSFSVGDVGMFFPTSEGNFLAFNVGCPGHFLSKECQDLIGRDEHFRPYYVLGRIIEIQDVTCGEDNPYNLPVDQDIKAVSVEAITPDLKAAGLQ